MVAPRDYYADLELPPTAEVQDIKKQYRKLALKYHPDRNPGREQEVNAQFLIIQSAHDILTDPQQKAKYDASRTRAGSSRYPAASGVRGNPWADVGQQFPTPPRRNQSNRNSASGAERWNSRFSSGVPPTARQSTTTNSETKKNAAKTFENMRRKPQTKDGSGARTSAAPPPTPPRTESAKQRQQASFGSRKNGYQPRASTYGDEPPVTNKNYAPRPDPPPRPDPKPAEAAKPQQAKPTRMPDPLSQFRDNSGGDGRQSSPYVTHSGERTNPFDLHPGQSGPAGHAPPTATGHFKTAHEQQANSNDTSTGRPEQAPGFSDSSAPRNDGQPSGHADPETPGATSSNSQANSSQNHPFFNVPDKDAQPSPERSNFARSSVDDINTSFVNDDGHTAWQFNAGGGEQSFSTTPQAHPDGREGQGWTSDPASMFQSEAANTQGQWNQTTSDAQFNADGWNDQFGPHTFVPPRANSSASPTKANRANSRKPKATKPVSGESGQNAILVDDSSDEETFTWRGRKGQAAAAAADSPQAMDIDSPPAEPRPETPQPNGARNVPVEPSRPEWRSGDFANADATKEKTPKPKQPPNPNAGGSEDSEEFKANFADLRNVAPFAKQDSGLKSFADMKDSLPFESKPSDELPIEQKASAVQHLVLPNQPEAPRPPLTMGVPNMKTNIPTWEKYVQDFEDYLRHWDTFTAQILEHFVTRKSQIDTSRKGKGYAFLRARGDADCLDYFKIVQQDNDVRRRWAAACDEHEQRFREFMACREKMK